MRTEYRTPAALREKHFQVDGFYFVHKTLFIVCFYLGQFFVQISNLLQKCEENQCKNQSVHILFCY